MEQTVNTFNKGLQMDTHPMVHGNDTLSDALNATFITQNGNEVILQNDMGNRKIDNAYLPTGYQPVGMKEYGGIIYVAAYNPITNKSQIGSFPSPERRIGEENSDLGGNLNLLKKMSGYWQPDIIEGNSSTNFTYKKSEGIKFLNEDSLLINLTSDTSLHAGDKFSVYSSDIWEWKKYITNFSNTLKEQSDWKDLVKTDISQKENESDKDYKTRIESYQDKIYSPKNKLYTLQLGILNSQNEFVDITKSLERWDKTGEIISFNNESDLYKFNKKYFIAENFNNNQGQYTGNDAVLIAERQKMAVNTYVYKLVGPLYLKATLNHIKDFSYSIQGYITDKNPLKAKLTITATITYNCPDEITGGNGNENFFTLDTEVSSSSSFPWFVLYKKNGDTYVKNNEDNEPTPTIINDIISYNEKTNLYTAVIEKIYDVEANNEDSFDYYICVQANSKTPNYYLEGLSTKGTLNLELLGSGQLKLIGWRFWNGWDEISRDSEAIITYTFENYPKYNHSFRNLRFKFKNVTDANNTNIKSSQIVDELIQTRGNKEFNWREFKDIYGNELLPRTLYEVTILYDEYEGDQIAKDENNQELKDLPLDCGNLFFLTTNLFNDCYSVNSSNFVNDFRKFSDLYKFEDEEEEKLFDPIRNSHLTITYDIIGKTIDNSGYKDTEILSSIIQKQNNNDRDYKIQNTYSIDLLLNYNLVIKDEKKYPDFITLGLYTSKYETKFEIEKEDSSVVNEGFNGDIEEDDYYSEINQVFTNKIEKDFKFFDILKADYYSPKDIYIENGFIDMSDQKVLQNIITPSTYNGIALYKNERANHRDEHYLGLKLNSTDKMSSFSTLTEIIDYVKQDNAKHYDSTNQKYQDALSNLAENSDSSSMFLYIFNTNNSGIAQYFVQSERASDSNMPATNYCKVWWRNSKDTLTLLNNKEGVFSSSNINKEIQNFINPYTNYVFCYYNSVSCTEAGIYIPKNYVYNTPYQIKLQAITTFKASNINLNKYTSSLLTFTAKNDYQKNIEKEFNLNSSNILDNGVDLILKGQLQNIYIETGTSIDINKGELDKNYIYIVKKGKLKKYVGSPFKVTQSHNRTTNTLLCNITDIGKSSSESLYQTTVGSSDGLTTFKFSGIPIINATNFKNE